MRDFILFSALIGVMGMSLLTLEAQRTEAATARELAATKAVCSTVDGDQSVFHFATDEIYFIARR